MPSIRPGGPLPAASARNPLPEGTVAVGSGLVVLGLTAYVYLAVAARALGAERHAALSVLWTLVFFAAPGFLYPLEQEVSRAVAARRAVGIGGGPVIRRGAVLGGGLVVALVLTSLALSGPMVAHLFDDQPLLLAGLLLSLPVYAATHLARGAFSGTGRFRSYGVLLASEGLVRVIAAVALAALGSRVAGAYGLVIALGPAVALLLVAPTARGLLEPGPPAPWSELSEALGWLLAGAVLAQGFVNASVPLVKILADDHEQVLVAQFQAGLIISRVPLFLFQAVQAALLPKLAGLAASGRLTDFRTGLRRLMAVVVVIGVAATIGSWAVGPLVLRLAFGSEFDQLGNTDLGLLALASASFMVATALAQALIALQGHAKVAAGWLAAVVVLGVVIAFGRGLLPRVEAGLVSGAAVAVVAMALLLRAQMRGGVPATAEPLLQAVAPDHELIEP